ncbi:hypothetical protein K438DRAFT_1784590 [Mycena galopus ATCC 62051]|nr:hypothetical protein K438DRAFT_1784590 [Mycena galopus ATCC 62051]
MQHLVPLLPLETPPIQALQLVLELGERDALADVNHHSQTRSPPRKKMNQYHLKKDQIPVEQMDTKAAGYLHGYILLGVPRSDIAPPLPTACIIADFQDRWEPGFMEKLCQTLCNTSNSTVGASQMVTKLRTKATKSLEAGIHETSYIETFHSAAALFAYYFLAPTISGSFQFSYMRQKVQIEQQDPGKLSENKDDNNSSHRRKQLAEKCIAFAIKDKQPNWVIALVENQCCNSDDESGTDDDHKKVYIVSKKSICCNSATSFIFQAKPNLNGKIQTI